MGNGKYILICLAMFFMSLHSMAQISRSQLPNSAFSQKPVNRILSFSPQKTSLIKAFSASPSHTSFGSFVHYPAFFCQMELKSANRLGVMVKIHAGDYDAYHDKR